MRVPGAWNHEGATLPQQRSQELRGSGQQDLSERKPAAGMKSLSGMSGQWRQGARSTVMTNGSGIQLPALEECFRAQKPAAETGLLEAG